MILCRPFFFFGLLVELADWVALLEELELLSLTGAEVPFRISLT